jgi:hypothetical protein
VTCYPPADWSCYPAVDSLDPQIKARSELLGWSLLNALLAYQIPGDQCPVAVRPCSRRCSAGTWYVAPTQFNGLNGYGNGTLNPSVVNGQWINSCGCAGDDCSCTTIQQIRLIGPIGGIVSVEIDGAALAPDAYRVDNGMWLVRQDGDAWPACQDMNAPEGTVGSFVVTYIQGYPTNPLFTMAAGMLAAEVAKDCTGQECALPANVTAITRQGVTMEMNANPFEGGTTGIANVDAVVKIFNPYGHKTVPRILSPDLPTPRQRTA